MIYVGDIMRISAGTQYIGGFHEYIGGYLVQWRDTMMHVGEKS